LIVQLVSWEQTYPDGARPAIASGYTALSASTPACARRSLLETGRRWHQETGQKAYSGQRELRRHRQPDASPPMAC
jgi:hypothetical protein